MDKILNKKTYFQINLTMKINNIEIIYLDKDCSNIFNFKNNEIIPFNNLLEIVNKAMLYNFKLKIINKNVDTIILLVNTF